MLLVSTPHIQFGLWVSICICMCIYTCIYPVFIETDSTGEAWFWYVTLPWEAKQRRGRSYSSWPHQALSIQFSTGADHRADASPAAQQPGRSAEPFLFRMRAPSSSHCHPVWWWSRAREVRSRAGRFTIKCTGIYPPAFAAVQNPHSHWVFWGPGSWQNLALPGICTTANVIVEVIHASEEVIRYHVYTYICLHVQTYIYAHTHHSFHIYMHTIE